MDLPNVLSLGSLLTGIIQVAVGIVQLYPASRRRWVSGPLLIGGAAICFAIAASLFWHPPTVTVEKPCPVAQQQTGDATSKGNQSPATTGNDNTVNYGSPTPAPLKEKAKK
jgi:hypothetical protein